MREGREKERGLPDLLSLWTTAPLRKHPEGNLMAPNPRYPLLMPSADGMLDATWPTRTVRFLLSDGTTVDVRTTRVDSDLSGALLEYLKVAAITGSVILTE